MARNRPRSTYRVIFWLEVESGKLPLKRNLKNVQGNLRENANSAVGSESTATTQQQAGYM
jgi:hypothetical protein